MLFVFVVLNDSKLNAMKNLLLVFGLLLGLHGMGQNSYKPEKVDTDTLPHQSLRQIDNDAFQAGEELKYTIHYGWIDAGEAVLRVENSKYKFGSRDAFHIVGTGKSLGTFDWFFKVRDRYETYIDKKGIFPHRFIRNCDEGGYKINQDYTFVPNKAAVVTEKEETPKTPLHVQDMISAFYYARTFDYSNAKPGDKFTVETIVDGEIFNLQLKFVKRETIKIREGKFKCMKFVPVLQEGRIFEDEDDMEVWISDDKNKIPVLVKTDILVGSIKMEMTDWKGLKNPLAKVD